MRTVLALLRKDMRLELRTFETVPAMVLFSLAVFVMIRMFAKGSPGTMNKEYQEATNEYLKVCLLLLLLV